MRFFNTAGPVNPADHYCIPPLERLDRDEALTLIDQKKYFVLHAPRQTGKTSALLALMHHLATLPARRWRCFTASIALKPARRSCPRPWNGSGN